MEGCALTWEFHGSETKAARRRDGPGGCDCGYPAQHSIKASANLWLRCKFQLPESLKDEWVCLFICSYSFIQSLIFPCGFWYIREVVQPSTLTPEHFQHPEKEP